MTIKELIRELGAFPNNTIITTYRPLINDRYIILKKVSGTGNIGVIIKKEHNN